MFIPPASIDTLYDYIPLLNDKPLVELPKNVLGKKIAIIGAGAAGMLAAFELMKMGFIPVIYEANGRAGGRLYSQPFQTIQERKPPFAEMGAMRIPRSSRIFLHYAKKLNLSFDKIFPSAGRVDTAIYYRDKLYLWKKNSPVPAPFAKNYELWNLFLQTLVDGIHQQWQQNHIETVRELWQMAIDQYKHMSLYQVIKERSPLSTNERLNIFGALGIGHGGFSPIFQVSFLEILRIIINRYMSDNLMISEGMSEFIERLYHLKIDTPTGRHSLADLHSLNLNLPVILLDYNLETKNPIIIVKDQDKKYHKLEFPAVLYTGTIAAANLINITNRTESGVFLLSPSVREAIKNSPMLPFSKTYICTESKFWIKHNIPSFILTDDLTRLSCFLDYPNSNYGVICLSYSWGVAANKLLSVEPKDRVVVFIRALKAVLPELEQYLKPMNGEVLNIDWVNQKYQNGAFKIFTPGYDILQSALYYQFQSVQSPYDKGVYLAGDSISWSGGWVEGALYTALNAVFAIAKRLGGNVMRQSPLSQDQNLYHY